MDLGGLAGATCFEVATLRAVHPLLSSDQKSESAKADQVDREVADLVAMGILQDVPQVRNTRL